MDDPSFILTYCVYAIAVILVAVIVIVALAIFFSQSG